MKQILGTPLKRFLRDWRRENPIKLDIAIVLDSVTYPANVGSLFRIADAAGVSQMVLCNATPLPNQKIATVGRGKHNRVDWRYEENTAQAVSDLRSEGYHICAIEITDQSAPYYEFDYPDKICFVLGNEDHGVTRAVLALCDSSVFVPMFGKGLSLNVHVSAAVVIYHFIQAHLAENQ